MVSLQVLEKSGKFPELARKRLAVASCGNAGLAAAVVARAADWPIDVFVPPTASPKIIARMREELEADVHICEDTEESRGLSADPCVLAFKKAVDGGAIPFSVQGNENGMVGRSEISGFISGQPVLDVVSSDFNGAFWDLLAGAGQKDS